MAKAAWFRLPPASITKLATAILLSRASAGRWHEKVEVIAEDLIGGSTMELTLGEVVTRRDILMGMLLPSGNDAAMTAARLIGPDWALQLNKLARNLGMTRTRFLTPHGRDAQGQASCARDLAVLARAAFYDPVIEGAAGQRRHQINEREIKSTVEILGEPGVRAGKTGSTARAGACLVLAYERFVICTLGSAVEFNCGFVRPETDRRYDDCRAIMLALDEHSTSAAVL